jgi:hypothetical protein
MASWGKAATRIRGEANADFLPLTSDRSGFIEDFPEYRSFIKAMEKTIAEVKRAYSQLDSDRENRRVSLAVKEARKREAHILNIARLITQEISLMKDPENPREAYIRQSKLLCDAFQEGDEKPAQPKWNKG